MPTALLLGATGLVGRYTLARLAGDARWGRVVTLDRRAVPRASGTHEPHVVDFRRLGDVDPALWTCDDVFCALGTTIKAAGSQAAFRRVDLEIPAEAARLARANGATQMLLVSSVGADAGSRIFYSRVKGEAEAAVRDAGFEAVQTVRPSLLTGDRDSPRAGEQVGEAVLGLLRPLLVGPLRNLRPTAADEVAAALVELAAAKRPGAHVYDPEAIRAWAATGPGGRPRTETGP
ncbi:MAG TPA: NAD(P)H-binding protein [Rubricoccaceae bacterium]